MIPLLWLYNASLISKLLIGLLILVRYSYWLKLQICSFLVGDFHMQILICILSSGQQLPFIHQFIGILFLYLLCFVIISSFSIVLITFLLFMFINLFYYDVLLQIKPLVSPTKVIVDLTDLKYSWHDLVSKGKEI